MLEGERELATEAGVRNNGLPGERPGPSAWANFLRGRRADPARLVATPSNC